MGWDGVRAFKGVYCIYCVGVDSHHVTFIDYHGRPPFLSPYLVLR
jgi:hypothetical protein